MFTFDLEHQFLPRQKLLDQLIEPPRMLVVQPPLYFHGRYDCLVDPHAVLTPEAAPPIDIITMDDNDGAIIAQALLQAKISSNGDYCSEIIYGRVAKLLTEGGMLPDWRLWQVGIDAQFQLCLHFAHQDQVQLCSVCMPLPSQLKAICFRIRTKPDEPSHHKLYLSCCTTAQQGLEVKVGEWCYRNQLHRHMLTIVTWYPDTDTIVLGDDMISHQEFLNAIQREQSTP